MLVMVPERWRQKGHEFKGSLDKHSNFEIRLQETLDLREGQGITKRTEINSKIVGREIHLRKSKVVF